MSDEKELEQCTKCDRIVYANCDICGWPMCAWHIIAVNGVAVCMDCRKKQQEGK